MAKYNNIFNAVNNEELSNLLLDSYKTMITETGDTSFSRFSETIMDILKDSVKPHSVRGSRKQDHSWKAELEAPFKGRGNGWIKFKAGSDAALAIIDKLDRMVLDNVDDYLKHTTREGMYWTRFVKVAGTAQAPLLVTEIRLIDPKVVHPKEYHITMPYSFFTEGGDMLGGTPVSLKLEVEPEPVVEDEVIDLADEVQEEKLVTSEADCDEMIDEEDDFFANI